jgi:hypothetical protein
VPRWLHPPALYGSDGRHADNAPRRRPVAPRREIDGSTATRADQAELLQITSPAGFEAFIAEAGEPAPEPVVPPPAEPDIAKLLRATAKYHKRMVGTPGNEEERR